MNTFRRPGRSRLGSKVLAGVGLTLCTTLCCWAPCWVAAVQIEESPQASALPALSNADVIMLAQPPDDGADASIQRLVRAALRAALDESPFLNLLSDVVTERVLPRGSGARTIDRLARACREANVKAILMTSIKQASPSDFQLQLSAFNCATGREVAMEQLRAERPLLVNALGKASERLRLGLGEPSGSVDRFSTPLERATSSSFEALDAWSSGLNVWQAEGATAALPLLARALQNDPAFAAAIYDLGLAYRNSGQEERARESFSRAFSMRSRASIRKRFNIESQYYAFVTVDDERAVKSFKTWARSYPRDYKAVSNLGSFYGDVCRYPEAIAQFEQARRMNPNDVVAHEDLMEMLTAVGDFQGARTVYQDIKRMHLDDDSPHLYLYVIATLETDTGEMASQAEWFEGKKELQHEILSEQADAAAYVGHLRQARELTARAVKSAKDAENLEQAAAWLLNSAWRESVLGDVQMAHDQAVEALSTAPRSREGEATAAILLARTGDIQLAEQLMTDIEKRYPNHRVMQSYWLPILRAQMALSKGDAASALLQLRRAAPLDLLYPQVFFYSHMPSVVIRAEALQLSGQPGRAAQQWQKILRNPGIVQLSATLPFAKLQLARSNLLNARGDSAGLRQARSAYGSFLDLWKDGDSDIPMLKQARAEFAKLQ